METLIKYVPDIIFYLITGYFFVKVYHFVALKQNSNDIEHLLISSFVTGYIICGVAYSIPFSISHRVDQILIVFFAIFLGYALGRLARSQFVNDIYDLLKIRDTGNVYMWDDLMDDLYPFEICISYQDVKYKGWVHNIESYSNSPHIALVGYTVEKDGNIIEDNRNDSSSIIILDTQKVDSVKVIYDKSSYKTKENNQLCNGQQKVNNAPESHKLMEEIKKATKKRKLK